ncbi:MAG: hypothetical protein AMXMBFR64_03760 [Myxococcales bacterium]
MTKHQGMGGPRASAAPMGHEGSREWDERLAPELEMLALALEPVMPSPEVRARVLRGAAATSRFDEFSARVAALLDLAVDAARALLARIDDPSVWEPGPAMGVSLYHVQGGAAAAGAITGFVRIPAGGSFPHHRHLGDEHVLILQGACDDGARVSRRGDLVSMPPDTEHDLRVLPGPPLVYLAVVHGGVQIGELVLRPGDPRA